MSPPISASSKTLNNDVNFEHIIEHNLSFTLEKSDENMSSCDVLRFGALHEVFDVEYIRCIGQGKRGLEQGTIRLH